MKRPIKNQKLSDYRKGYCAALKNVPLHLNPFEDYTDRYNQWNKGWYDVQHARGIKMFTEKLTNLGFK